MFYGGKGHNQFLDVKSLPDDGAICAGQTDLKGNGDSDGWLTRTDQYGMVVWSEVFGQKSNDYFKKVIQTKDGDFVACGMLETADFPQGQAWAVKVDNDGNLLWSYALDVSTTTMQSLCETTDGGLALLATVNLEGAGTKIIVIKLAPTGSVQWIMQYYEDLSDYGDFITQAKDNNLLVSGFTFDFGAGMHDGYLMKVSVTDGTLMWLKSYGNPMNNVIDAVVQNAAGDLFLPIYWGNEAALIKTDPDGNPIWSRSYSFPIPNSRVMQSKLTPDGGLLLGVWDGGTKGAVAKVNGQGLPQWGRMYFSAGDTDVQYPSSVLPSGKGYDIAGYTGASDGFTNAFLIKTDTNGLTADCNAQTIDVTSSPVTPAVENHIWASMSNITGWVKHDVQSSQLDIAEKRVCPLCCSPTDTTIDTAICQGTKYILPDGTSVGKAGVYTVKLTSIGGCDSVITTNLSINPSYHQTALDTICAKEILTLPDGRKVDSTGVFVSALTTVKGCDSIITTKLTVMPLYATTVTDSICPSMPYTLPDGRIVDTAGTYVSHLRSRWGCDSAVTTILSYRGPIRAQFDDSICEGSTITLPQGRTISQEGDYTMLISPKKGCDTLATFHVRIKRLPHIDLGPDTCLVPGQSLQLDPGKGYLQYLWQNGRTSETQQVIFPGNYWVKVSNACGSDIDTIRVTGGCLPVIFVPSAFTPNGDGTNDLFHILNVHGQKLQSFDIYNRLGERVFHTESIATGWNGTFRGKQEPPASYVYIIKITDLEGKPKMYRGTVLLIR